MNAAVRRDEMRRNRIEWRTVHAGDAPARQVEKVQVTLIHRNVLDENEAAIIMRPIERRPHSVHINRFFF